MCVYDFFQTAFTHSCKDSQASCKLKSVLGAGTLQACSKRKQKRTGIPEGLAHSCHHSCLCNSCGTFPPPHRHAPKSADKGIRGRRGSQGGWVKISVSSEDNDGHKHGLNYCLLCKQTVEVKRKQRLKCAGQSKGNSSCQKRGQQQSLVVQQTVWLTVNGSWSLG